MKDKYILAIESSCDETSAAVVVNGREVLSNVIASQIDTHKKYGGVVPEVASRMHIEAISGVVEEALEKANVTLDKIDAIGVTYGPGLVGALLVGLQFAKGLSFATKKPLIGVNHIEGHICANYIQHKELKPPFVSLVVSGGHTFIVHVKDYGNYEVIGQTRDDAAGEAYDKIGRVLGVNYPAGKTIDTWAHQGNDTFNFPRAMLEDDDYDFSFSGLKSAFINTCHHADQIGEKLDKYDLAASFQAAVVDVLSHKTIRAIKEFKPKTFVLGGGVAANRGLRERLEAEIGKLDTKPKVIIPPMKLCGDNAAMIGAAAYNLYKAGKFSGLDLNADPSLELPYADAILDR